MSLKLTLNTQSPAIWIHHMEKVSTTFLLTQQRNVCSCRTYCNWSHKVVSACAKRTAHWIVMWQDPQILHRLYEFWLHVTIEHPVFADEAMPVLLPFSITHNFQQCLLCRQNTEAGCISMTWRLRVYMTIMNPVLTYSSGKIQVQPPHWYLQKWTLLWINYYNIQGLF
jgi:hypothetical protein